MDRGTDRGQDSPRAPPGPDTLRVPEQGGLGHCWSGAECGEPPLVPPLAPPLPRCLYLFCDSFCTWGSCRGVSLGHGGTAPPSPPSTPKSSCAPPTAPRLPQWGGGHLGRCGPGSGGCESPLPWGFGLSPPPWGCPGLALAGRAGSGGGGSHWRGCFLLRGQVGTHSPPKFVQLCLHSAVGGLGGLAVPTQGGHRGLHAASLAFGAVWGWVWGWGELLWPSLCQTVWGRGTPTCQRPLGGSWQWSKTGGAAQPGFSTEPPPHLVSPGQLCVPSVRAWGPAAALGGSLGTPTGSAFVRGGPGPAPRCAGRGGTGPSGWIQVTPCPVIPPLPAAVLHRRGCAGDSVGSVPSVVPAPPHGCLSPHLAVCPQGGLWLSPHPGAVAHPLAGAHKLWCSRLWIHYCFQTAAKGWAGGVLQSPGRLKKPCGPPPTAWGPPCGPSWRGFGAGRGGLATGACQAGLCVPRGLRTGLWAPKKHGGATPNCLGHGELGAVWGGSLSPFSCWRGAAIWGPKGVTGA